MALIAPKNEVDPALSLTKRTTTEKALELRARERENFRKPAVLICTGCQELEKICQARTHAILYLGSKEDPSRTDDCVVHGNFPELDACARLGCWSCRVFRQSIILSITSIDDLFELTSEISKRPVVVSAPRTLKPWSRVAESTLTGVCWQPEGKLTLGHAKTWRYALSKRNHPVGSKISSSVSKAVEWLTACRGTHASCDGLKASHMNPRRLIEIITPKNLRIVSALKDRRVEYCTLSYCWGMQIGENPTITTLSNVVDRENGFDLAEMTPTIQDAITLAFKLGIKFIWIDAICLVQDDHKNKTKELSRMHEIYGNALVTISLASNSSQSQRLLSARKAFSLRVKPCKIGSWDLKPADPREWNIHQMRQDSPLSKRGWTLQEELLSPRVLYWSRYGMYWSCSNGTQSELCPLMVEPPVQEILQVARNEPQSPRLHELWRTTVVDYTRRCLSNAQDRMPALLGIASTYAFATRQSLDQDYFFGIWRESFVEDLQWHVKNEISSPFKDDSHVEMAPSWSWASLPFRTAMPYPAKHAAASNDILFIHFEIDAENQVGSGHIVVQARHRRLLSPDAQQIAWSEPRIDAGGMHYNHFLPDIFAYAVNPDQGTIIVSYPRLPKITCKLDTLPVPKCDTLEAIQINAKTMMVAQRVGEDVSTYRRVGFAFARNWDFFRDKDCETSEIILV